MAKTLVIVESPSKAKTIEKYLGSDYMVESSVGHIRDLPRSAEEIPAEYKGQTWARLGINVDHEFEPIYVVSQEKRQVVAKLKQLVKQASEVILATDDDREGESIAWHLSQELKPKVPIKRMVFHEITKEAIFQAIQNPRSINEDLVEAQETRRALDRLYGYEVSPVLWRKIAPKLSAGRVQSVATRLLVQRERERMRFVSGSYASLEALLSTQTGPENGQSTRFPSSLLEIDQVRLASGKDFDENGQLKNEKVRRLREKEAAELGSALEGKNLTVRSLEEKPFTQRPYPPFITSTLQQEGSRKLGWTAKRVMQVAQKLYEGGHITYMRTDSTTLSKEAIEAARTQVSSMYGPSYLPAVPRTYDKKSKNAQEAHEAVRPAGSSFKTPDALRSQLSDEEARLYDLIWKRTVASQMADAKGRRTSVRLEGQAQLGNSQNQVLNQVLFGASGQVIDFAGFLRAYVEGSDDPEAALDAREVILPALVQGQTVSVAKISPKAHQTQPPARYTEASLVQALEGAGIGRPSTYASILSTIQDRGYVSKKGTALVPTWTGFATVQLLEGHFPKLVDYDFTARMEEDLDEIAGGRQDRLAYLKAFYGGEEGLRTQVALRIGEIDPIAISTIPVPRLEGSGIEVRVGKWGAYLKRDEAKMSLPEGLIPDELDLIKAEDLLSRAGYNGELGLDPVSNLPVFAKNGRFGPYIQLGEAKAPAPKVAKGADKATGTKTKTAKNKTEKDPDIRFASLFPGENLEDMTLERALELLSIPRVVGVLDGLEVVAKNGKFGPYLEKGEGKSKDNRSLENHELLLTITLEQAKVLFDQPGRKRSAIGSTLKLFEYPDRSPIEIKLGRFGPYICDENFNAWLRKEEDAMKFDAVEARNVLLERGKPPKAKEDKKGAKKTATKTVAKTASKPSSAAAKPAAKTASKTATKAPAKKATAPAKPASVPIPWATLKGHLGTLSDLERTLIVAMREEGKKAEEVAPGLGLEVAKAKGMALQISKKLNQAARAVAGTVLV